MLVAMRRLSPKHRPDTTTTMSDTYCGDTYYEDKLGDALEQLLGEGTDDLHALAAGLNKLGFAPAGGASWTVASLEAEFKRLAAGAASK